MDVIEAIIYCIDFVCDKPEDGEYQSQIVWDVNGDSHWFSWKASKNEYGDCIDKNSSPRMCSSGPTPFTKGLEPYSYSMFKKEKNELVCRN